jgi:hypothetical protein
MGKYANVKVTCYKDFVQPLKCLLLLIILINIIK